MRRPMDPAVRAKQFQPFDALKGFREALAEKERDTVPRKELSPEQEEEIDYMLTRLRQGDVAAVEYYSEGEYRRIMGEVSGISKKDRMLEINKVKILFDDISEVR